MGCSIITETPEFSCCGWTLKDYVKTKSIDSLNRMLKVFEGQELYEQCAIIKNELERREIAEKF